MNLVKYNVKLIERLIDLIEMFDDKKWSSLISTINNETIGRHFRHISDFYIQFFEGVLNKNINYDKRSRNELVERKPEAAIQVFNEIIKNFNNSLDDDSIQITMNSTICDEKITSSITRELMNLIDHTIHHGHIIQIAIQNEFTSIDIKESFYSPSTIASLKCVQ